MNEQEHISAIEAHIKNVPYDGIKKAIESAGYKCVKNSTSQHIIVDPLFLTVGTFNGKVVPYNPERAKIKISKYTNFNHIKTEMTPFEFSKKFNCVFLGDSYSICKIGYLYIICMMDNSGYGYVLNLLSFEYSLEI